MTYSEYPHQEIGQADRERLESVVAETMRLFGSGDSTPRRILEALEADGYAIVERDKCEPWLGCATTRQLIEELTARIDVLGQLDYSTVGGTPGLVPVGGDS